MLSRKSKQSSASFLGVVFLLLLLVGAAAVITQRQVIIDTVRASQYAPTSDEQSLMKDLALTKEGDFLFDASQPQLQAANMFNKSCSQSRETNNPILGCYSRQTIYVYSIDQEKLVGIKQTTAAHELLHAAYERMNANKKKTVDAELQKVYEKQKTPKLEERMAYYQKAEPGEELNELHSILGTENADLGSVLETHYKQYFTDRAKIVGYYQQYSKTFTDIAAKLENLQKTITTQTTEINNRIESYSTSIAALKADQTAFIAKNNRQGFKNVSEFDTAQNALNRRVNTLNAERASIQAAIDEVNTMRTQYNNLATEYNQLNQSLNSTLPPTPKLSKEAI